VSGLWILIFVTQSCVSKRVSLGVQTRALSSVHFASDDFHLRVHLMVGPVLSISNPYPSQMITLRELRLNFLRFVWAHQLLDGCLRVSVTMDVLMVDERGMVSAHQIATLHVLFRISSESRVGWVGMNELVRFLTIHTVRPRPASITYGNNGGFENHVHIDDGDVWPETDDESYPTEEVDDDNLEEVD